MICDLRSVNRLMANDQGLTQDSFLALAFSHSTLVLLKYSFRIDIPVHNIIKSASRRGDECGIIVFDFLRLRIDVV